MVSFHCSTASGTGLPNPSWTCKHSSAKIPETIPQNTPVCAGKTKDSPVRDTVSSSWSPGCRVSPTACSPGRAQPTGSGTFPSTGTDPPRPSALESSSSSPPAPTAASPPWRKRLQAEERGGGSRYIPEPQVTGVSEVPAGPTVGERWGGCREVLRGEDLELDASVDRLEAGGQVQLGVAHLRWKG